MMAGPSDIAGGTRAPIGALRVLSRHDGAEILLLSSENRPVGVGEVLQHVSWWPSEAAAAAVVAWCAETLADAHAPAGEDGWHPFPAQHVETLLRTAKSHLNADIVPSEAREARRWDGRRIARFGQLVGLGWTAKRIADDPSINSTPGNVYRQAHRFGLSLTQDSPRGQVNVRLPMATLATLDKVAASAGVTRDTQARHWLIEKATEAQAWRQGDDCAA